jgi:DnaK suppressor protein
MTLGNKLSADDRDAMRALLLARRQELLGDVTHLENDTIKSSRKDSTGDLSTVPYHMADVASDSYEEEFALERIQNSDEELREINEAIGRIDRNDFGACVSCHKPIPKKRLMAIPYAQTCIECKRTEEKASKSLPRVPET